MQRDMTLMIMIISMYKVLPSVVDDDGGTVHELKGNKQWYTDRKRGIHKIHAKDKIISKNRTKKDRACRL